MSKLTWPTSSVTVDSRTWMNPLLGLLNLALWLSSATLQTMPIPVSLISLTLSSTVIQSKDPHIHISTTWDNHELTLEQETHVALEVYAGTAILESFNSIPMGTPVSLSTQGGTCVKLLSRDQTSTVSYGIITLHCPPTFGGVCVTPTHVIVNITSVIASAYLIQAELTSSDEEILLSHFGTAFPFSLLCKMKDLETNADKPADHAPDHHSAPLPPHPLLASAEHANSNLTPPD